MSSEHGGTDERERRGGGLLRRHPDFRRFWVGETAGKLGAATNSVVIPLIAVSSLDASTFEVGLLTASTWLPWLLIGLPVGAWVDRMRRRPIMVAAMTVSLVVYCVIPVAAWLDLLSVSLLLLTSVLAGAAAVFFQTAYTAYLPALLEAPDRAEGNAKLHGSASAAQIAGLGSGGVAAQAVGAANAVFASSVTFAVSLVSLLRIRHREQPPQRPADGGGSLVREVSQGLRLVTGDVWLRSLMLFGSSSNLFLMGYQSILVLFLVREVGFSEGAAGSLLAGASIGGVLGALVARRIAARMGTARALLLLEIGVPALGLLMPLTTTGLGAVTMLIAGGSISAGVVAGNIIVATFRQQYCPAHVLGRVTASTSFVNYGTLPLGGLLGGTLGSLIGVVPALWVLLAGLPLCGLILVFSPVGRVRDLPVTQLNQGTGLGAQPAHS